jgi:hypothetical protein
VKLRYKVGLLVVCKALHSTIANLAKFKLNSS